MMQRWKNDLVNLMTNIRPKQKVTLGKPNNEKPNPESNCTFVEGKEPKKNLYSKFGVFRDSIVRSTYCFMHKKIETRTVMNLSTLNPWKLKFKKKIDNANNVVVNCIGR
jgi:hypothetical protein